MFRSEQFTSDRGLGRVALAALGLGFVLALHLALLAYAVAVVLQDQGEDDGLSSARWQCVVLWALYMSALCFFHVAEFMTTASFRPSIVSYECKCVCCGSSGFKYTG